MQCDWNCTLQPPPSSAGQPRERGTVLTLEHTVPRGSHMMTPESCNSPVIERKPTGADSMKMLIVGRGNMAHRGSSAGKMNNKEQVRGCSGRVAAEKGCSLRMPEHLLSVSGAMGVRKEVI